LGRNALAVIVAACIAQPVHANPVGPEVVNGSASFSSQGNVLSVTNSPSAILNWHSFSIAQGEISKYVQRSAASAVLNRALVLDASSILGVLQSNGRVFLINPNGIVFGQGAQINVAGLVASTLNLSNEDFLAGRLNFTDTPGAKGINNQGNITTPAGGQEYLVAPDINNSGVITSPHGDIILAAGKSVELVDPAR
jgi:filamentous hemagglutinin family protein